MTPRVNMKYLQPILIFLVQTPSAASLALHERFGINAQAINEVTRFPTGHQTDNNVNRFPLSWGRNSRNNAPSTGRFPPIPMPTNPNITATAIHEGAPPIAIPKAEAIPRVVLKAIRRPTISESTPHTIAPMQRPVAQAVEIYPILSSGTENSRWTDGKMRARPLIDQQAPQPNQNRLPKPHALWNLLNPCIVSGIDISL
jgi:hypothetical protein